MERGHYKNYELTINVTVPDLNSVHLSGSGRIEVNDFTSQNDLEIDISGSGQIDLNAFSGAEKMYVDISGSGTVTAYDEMTSLKKLNINISGSGGYKGFPVKSDECKINVSGSGTCQVSVRNTLEVSIGGSGVVYYRGNPSITSHTNRAGSIVDAN